MLREYQEERDRLLQELAKIQSGADPSQVMAHHGVMSGGTAR